MIMSVIACLISILLTLVVCHFLPKEKVRSQNRELEKLEQEAQLRIKELEKTYAEKDNQLNTEYQNRINTLQAQNNELYAEQQQVIQQINTEKQNWEKEKSDKNLELIQQTKELEIEVRGLETKRDNIIQTLEQEAKESGKIFKQQQIQIAEEQIESAKKEMTKEYEEATANAKDTYLEVIADLVREVNEKYAVSSKELEEALAKLADIQAKTTAAIEVNKRAELEKSEKDFYRLQLSDVDLEEIARLRSVAPYLRDKEPLNKVIYKCYYEKPYTDLVGRVFNGRKPSGIYKITNLQNGKCYIGQATNIPERWRQHIKRGVGADTPTQNKLYPAMLEIGVENFMFEVVEECKGTELTPKEKYWTDFYGAQTYGYVVKKG